MESKFALMEFIGGCLWAISLIVYAFGTADIAYLIVLISVLISEYIKYRKTKRELNK